MRQRRLVIVVFALWGCRSSVTAPARESVATDGAKPAHAPSAPPVVAPVPFALVASGRNLTLTVVHDGKSPRVRVVGAAFAAQANGAGPLIGDAAAGPPPRAPGDSATHTISNAGVAPNLFAFRRKNVPCLVPDDAAVLAWTGKSWREQRLRGRLSPPHAFLEFDGVALLVDSPVGACGWATSSPVERLSQPTGTVFTQVPLAGAVTHPTFGLDPNFMAWGASSAGQALALVGTYGVRGSGAAPPAFGSHDIVVMRRDGQGAFKASLIVKMDGPASQSVRTRLREFGAAALLWPPPARDDGTPASGAPAEGGDEIAWKGHAASIFRITDDATTEFRFRSASEQDCQVADAAVAGDTVYALTTCPGGMVRLVRAAAHGAPERIELPSAPEVGACAPRQLAGGAPDDLWVLATCAPAGKPEIDAVFRRGAPQVPLQAP